MLHKHLLILVRLSLASGIDTVQYLCFRQQQKVFEVTTISEVCLHNECH